MGKFPVPILPLVPFSPVLNALLQGWEKGKEVLYLVRNLEERGTTTEMVHFPGYNGVLDIYRRKQLFLFHP